MGGGAGGAAMWADHLSPSLRVHSRGPSFPRPGPCRGCLVSHSPGLGPSAPPGWLPPPPPGLMRLLTLWGLQGNRGGKGSQQWPSTQGPEARWQGPVPAPVCVAHYWPHLCPSVMLCFTKVGSSRARHRVGPQRVFPNYSAVGGFGSGSDADQLWVLSWASLWGLSSPS